MFSNDEDSHESEAAPKVKRVQRACDMCRRKKQIQGVVTEEKGATTARITISSAHMLNRQLCIIRTLETLLAQANTESPGLQAVMNAMRQLKNRFPAPDRSDLTSADIDESFRLLSINNGIGQGFQGKSSNALLVKTAIELKTSPAPDLIANRRLSPAQCTEFPGDDLLASLASLYFDNVNNFLPLLHRASFESCLRQHFHLIHAGFAKTLLLVCAIGARYSTDPCVSTPGSVMAETAGWKWFDQVDLSGYAVHTRPTLYDLQSFCLAAEFLAMTSSHRTCWRVVGFGMRFAQDIGAHRSKGRSGPTTLEQELERHAFWVLWFFDIQLSAALGRSTVLRPQDFDIEMPSATLMFYQPASKPSVISFFNCMLELTRILGACGILYSTNYSRIFLGLDDVKLEWQKDVIVELNSALNSWFNEIPDHLRWDANHPIPDDTFFDQSAALHCMYYYTRIMIHRPFLLEVRGSPNSRHLAICNTAARACSQVAEIQQQRRPNNALWFSQTPLFTSALVLLLDNWGRRSGSRVGDVPAAEKDLVDVHRCLEVLSVQQQKWPSAGYLLDTLRQLLALDQRPWAPRIVHANNEPQSSSSRVPYPSAQSERHFEEPQPVVLSPPIYDPQQENPPQHHPAHNTSYSRTSMDPPNAQGFLRPRVLSGEEQTHMSVAYPPLDEDSAALGRVYPYAQGIHGEDFDMGGRAVEPPWPRASTTFGTSADWAGYLANHILSSQPSTRY
ncbi:fungal-specific transcription factor domain-containing protein [Mycena epipterygia]|nr:fungal-specific transcription factor domain-containing protein [Mycena epipterygia]